MGQATAIFYLICRKAAPAFGSHGVEVPGLVTMCAAGASYSQVLIQHSETQVSVKWHQYVWHPPDFLRPIIFVKPSYALLQHQPLLNYCFSGEVSPRLVLCQKPIAVELKRKAQVVFALCAGFLGKVTGEDSPHTPPTFSVLYIHVSKHYSRTQIEETSQRQNYF